MLGLKTPWRHKPFAECQRKDNRKYKCGITGSLDNPIN